MSSESAHLAPWASRLTLAEIPPDVRQLARLQHVAAAGMWSGSGPLDAGDPFVLACRSSREALPWLWADPPKSVGALVAATVAANEVGGRVGLARLLDARAVEPDAVASAAARAGAARNLGGGDPVEVGPPVAVPLPGATAGLGTTWLTRTLVAPRFAGPPWATVALEGLHEILERHVKAAEKRLRADQVERIEVRLPWLVWGREQVGVQPGLADRMGVLVAFHTLGREEAGDPSARADEVAWVASTVELRHDWALSLRLVDAAARGLHPLLGGFGVSGYRAVRGATKARGGWPGWTGEDLLALARARPDRVWSALRGTPGDLAAVDLGRFTWCLPVEIKLYTSRGGWWPERRSAPTGTGAGLEPLLRARDAAAVDRALALPDDAPAAELLAALGVR